MRLFFYRPGQMTQELRGILGNGHYRIRHSARPTHTITVNRDNVTVAHDPCQRPVVTHTVGKNAETCKFELFRLSGSHDNDRTLNQQIKFKAAPCRSTISS